MLMKSMLIKSLGAMRLQAWRGAKAIAPVLFRGVGRSYG